MTLDQINYFKEIVSAGSMNQAAKNLFISQPNISLTIKTLENELGYKLFRRHSTGVQLTQQGNAFLYHIEHILENIDNINKIDCKHSKIEPKKLNISSEYSLASILPIIHMMETLESDAFELKHHQREFSNVIEDVFKKHADLGIITIHKSQVASLNGMLINKGLEFHIISELIMGVVVSEDHPLSNKASLSHKDIKKYPQIRFDIDSRESPASFTLLETTYNQSDKIISLNDIFHLLICLKETSGFALIPYSNSNSFNTFIGNMNIPIRFIPLSHSAPVILGYIDTIGEEINYLKSEFIKKVTLLYDKSTEKDIEEVL
ncbi:LysR family transcriptional regulator [Fusibacter ferrireducens]|uniref:LysR family transcriptional regulator n=1 Tax=Fusibacter ferrireducens TaxID=2785058 RepID=A0ABR9ZP24_9FIRM|nr:LysR family transcriptional regulator [Fusibacter ferrireducens]MBF4692217.1 LysR family transcriptional regulator [Fusibacter ferrireducens]